MSTVVSVQLPLRPTAVRLGKQSIIPNPGEPGLPGSPGSPGSPVKVMIRKVIIKN